MEYANLIGNWCCFKTRFTSDGACFMCIIRMRWWLCVLDMTAAWITWLCMCRTISLILLNRPCCRPRLHRSMIMDPTFKYRGDVLSYPKMSGCWWTQVGSFTVHLHCHKALNPHWGRDAFLLLVCPLSGCLKLMMYHSLVKEWQCLWTHKSDQGIQCRWCCQKLHSLLECQPSLEVWHPATWDVDYHFPVLAPILQILVDLAEHACSVSISLLSTMATVPIFLCSFPHWLCMSHACDITGRTWWSSHQEKECCHQKEYRHLWNPIPTCQCIA